MTGSFSAQRREPARWREERWRGRGSFLCAGEAAEKGRREPRYVPRGSWWPRSFPVGTTHLGFANTEPPLDPRTAPCPARWRDTPRMCRSLSPGSHLCASRAPQQHTNERVLADGKHKSLTELLRPTSPSTWGGRLSLIVKAIVAARDDEEPRPLGPAFVHLANRFLLDTPFQTQHVDFHCGFKKEIWEVVAILDRQPTQCPEEEQR